MTDTIQPRTISRRSVAMGIAWTTPVILGARPLKAYAASPLSCQALIDKAFTEIQSGLTAYWTEIAAGNLNGTAKTVAFNINNHTPYDVVLQSGSSLVVEFDVINSDGTTYTRTNGTSASTSWGTESNVNPGTTTYNGNTLTSGEVTWTATGLTLPGQDAAGADNTADIAISVPGNTIIGATLRQVPLVKPAYADIVAANPTTTFTPECQTYYDSKAAVPMAITIAGPNMTGTQALYGVQNNSGDVALAGGSANWAVGTTYWSNTIGNYIHDGNAATAPSVAGVSYSRDGIF